MSAGSVDQLLDQLRAAWKILDEKQRALLVGVAEAMGRAPVTVFNPDSDLLSNPDFRHRFTNRLVVHHGTTAQRLVKLAFEYAFVDAGQAADWSASRSTSETRSGPDVDVEGIHYSLKTEGAESNINYEFIRISKFRESAGLKGRATASGLHAFVQNTLVPQVYSYDRLLILRSFTPLRVSELAKTRELIVGENAAIIHAESMGNEVVYQLVEVPIDLLRRLSTLRDDDFKFFGRAGSARAIVTDENRRPAFGLLYDGSDDKVTLEKIDMALCTIHGTWSIPER